MCLSVSLWVHSCVCVCVRVSLWVRACVRACVCVCVCVCVLRELRGSHRPVRRSAAFFSPSPSQKAPTSAGPWVSGLPCKPKPLTRDPSSAGSGRSPLRTLPQRARCGTNWGRGGRGRQGRKRRKEKRGKRKRKRGETGRPARCHQANVLLEWPIPVPDTCHCAYRTKCPGGNRTTAGHASSGHAC